MTIKRIEQHKSSLKEQILDNLMPIMELTGMGQLAIAQKLGYTKDVFSQMKSGFSNGSPQLLAALLLLKELTILKRSGVNQELARELDRMKTRIEELQQQVSPRYPEHTPQHLAMNEEAASSDVAAADVAHLKEAISEAGTRKPRPRSK